MTIVRRLGGVRGMAVIAAAGVVFAGVGAVALPADAAVRGFVRVDQAGYLPGESSGRT